jgi:hypothetical protein
MRRLGAFLLPFHDEVEPWRRWLSTRRVVRREQEAARKVERRVRAANAHKAVFDSILDSDPKAARQLVKLIPVRRLQHVRPRRGVYVHRKFFYQLTSHIPSDVLILLLLPRFFANRELLDPV